VFELDNRFNAALAPAAATTKLTGDYGAVYQAALNYLDGASAEEKATTNWNEQRAGGAAGRAGHPEGSVQGHRPASWAILVAAISRNIRTAAGTATQSFSDVAKAARASLDAQASAATAAGKLLTYDPADKSGQLTDLSGIDSRSLSAIALNQDKLFSGQESFAAKQQLDFAQPRQHPRRAENRASRAAIPTQLSIGILNAYSAMSAGSGRPPTGRRHCATTRCRATSRRHRCCRCCSRRPAAPRPAACRDCWGEKSPAPGDSGRGLSRVQPRSSAPERISRVNR